MFVYCYWRSLESLLELTAGVSSLLVPISRNDSQFSSRSCKETALATCTRKPIEILRSSNQTRKKLESLPHQHLSFQKTRWTQMHTPPKHTPRIVLKRPRDTSSSTGESPFTSRSRPPCMRLTTKRRFDKQLRMHTTLES